MTEKQAGHDGDHEAILATADRLAEACSLLKKHNALDKLLAASICQSNAWQPNKAFVRVLDAMMELDIRDAVCAKLYAFGAFEPDLSAFYSRALRPGQTFFDVGAHYGYFSLLASSRVGPTGQVVAFEPSQRTADALARNAARARGGPVKVERLAVWRETGRLVIKDYGVRWAAFNTFADMRIDPRVAVAAERELDVEAVSLDDYVAGTSVRPDFVKIDVESAEMQVLDGMKQLISENPPVISVEVGDMAHLIAQGVERTFDIMAAMSSAGYELFWPSLAGLKACTPDAQATYAYSNVIGLPAHRRDEVIATVGLA